MTDLATGHSVGTAGGREEGSLRAILDQSPIGVSVSRRRDGSILFTNARFAELVGIPKGAFVGRNARELYADEAQRMAIVAELKGKGGVYNVEAQFRRADGSPFWTLLTINSTVFENEPVNLAWIYDISDRKTAEEALRESEQRLLAILDESSIGVSVSRRGDGVIVYANARFSQLIGMPRDRVVGTKARDYFVDDHQRGGIVEALRRDGCVRDAEVEFKRTDGTPFWTLLTINSTWFREEPVNLAWIYDITERRQTESKLRLAATVVDSANEAIMISNAYNRIEFVNPAFTEITEYQPEEVIGKNPKVLASGRHDRAFYRGMWQSIRENNSWQGEIWNKRKSGEFYAQWMSIVVLKNNDDRITHYITLFYDITRRKEHDERVWHRANFDLLTGLPNRALFLDRLAQAIRHGERIKSKFALMFLDLDGFKAVNDTLGHAAGDQLLQETARRLSGSLRDTDTVARLAGDEFVVIINDLDSIDSAKATAARILERLRETFLIGEERVHVRGSIGIAIYPLHATDGETLLRLADSAMYHVKTQGKGTFKLLEMHPADWPADRPAAGVDPDGTAGEPAAVTAS